MLMKASVGAAVGFEVGAGVEAEPANPQQRGADHGQRQVVRRHRLLAVTDALADQVGANQAGHRGVDVHHGATGEVVLNIPNNKEPIIAP